MSIVIKKKTQASIPSVSSDKVQIFVDSADDKLKYKDENGDVGIVASEEYVDILLPQEFILWENMSARDISTFWIDGGIYKYIWSYFTNSVGTYAWTMYLQDYVMIDTNKILLVYTLNEWWGAYYHYAVVWTISWITITLWTPLKYYGWAMDWSATAKVALIDTNKVVVWFHRYSWTASADNNHVAVLTISWTTISAGSDVWLKTSNFTNEIYDIVKVWTDKFVVRWQWDNATNRAFCWTISWTTITLWALANITWDKLVYVSDDVFLSTSWNNVYRASISWTTITEWNNLDNTNLTSYSRTYVDSTRQVLTWLSWWNLVSVVINWTPTTPTQWSYYTIKTTCDSTQWACLVWTNKLVYNYWVAWASEFQLTAILDINIINKQYELQLTSTTPVWLKPIYAWGRYIYKWYGGNTTINNVFTLPSEYNWIFWLLYESSSLWQSKQIYTEWFTLSGFTWLIPWVRYYVGSSYILSPNYTTGVWYGKEIWIAISSTKLLITV